MEEKYITKLLNFSDEIICNAKELVITKEQGKGIIKELEQDYISKAIIKLKIADLKQECKQALEKNSIEGFILKCQIEILEKLLRED